MLQNVAKWCKMLQMFQNVPKSGKMFQIVPKWMKMLSVICHLPYAICQMLSAMYHLLHAIQHILSTICHLQYAIYHVPSILYHISCGIYHIPYIICHLLLPSTKCHLPYNFSKCYPLHSIYHTNTLYSVTISYDSFCFYFCFYFIPGPSYKHLHTRVLLTGDEMVMIQFDIIQKQEYFTSH